MKYAAVTVSLVLISWLMSPLATSNNGYSTLEFSDQEKLFIQQHSTISLGAGASFAPFVIKNQDGSYSGHDVDIVNIVAARTGLNFRFETSQWRDIQTRALNRELDGLTTSAQLTEERSRSFNATNPYLALTSLVLVKKGNPKGITTTSDIAGKKVAMQKGNVLFEGILTQLNFDVEVVYYDTIHELISAVVSGAADLCILDETAPYIANQLGLSGYIEVAFPVGTPFELVFLLRKDWPELTSIFNKGLASIREEEKLEIRNFWFRPEESELDYLFLAKLSGAMIFLLSGLLAWSYSLRKSKNETEKALSLIEAKDKELEAKNALLETLSITDHLTRLYNRSRLDEVLEAEIQKSDRYQTGFAIIMVDIDFFKQVNDTYGHPAGDQVLVEFSALLESNSRKVDTVGRWGGEEFLIICPNADQKGSVALAESLRSTIEQHHFSIVERRTASFGVAVYETNDSSHRIIDRADQALYRAKEQGRNQTILNAIDQDKAKSNLSEST
jgi:diguanylate cyclase (GGDEF)-like protein